MKAVILAGGLGTRIGEETEMKPKPMIEIGGLPIIVHIMKTYASHNITDFIVCCGYKGHLIKEYFAKYFLYQADVTFDLKDNRMLVHNKRADHWKVTLVDTGLNTMTGGRLKKVKSYCSDDDFCFTYGDGVADVDITRLIDFHRSHGKKATLTAVNPRTRFGALSLENHYVTSFTEKPKLTSDFINGGYFVLSPDVFEYIDGPSTSWEASPLIQLSQERELMAYKHTGFWQPMDTLKEKNDLQALWDSGHPPWKCWD